VTPLATSTFLQVVFASLFVIPIIILWVAAVTDAIGRHSSGWTLAALLLGILVFPILGPLVYFILRKSAPVSAEEAYLADADLRREAARRPVGGTGM
jgi:hypothetical protein